MKHKWQALLLVVVMAFFVASCQRGDSPGAGAQDLKAEPGDKLHGFTLKETGNYDAIGAKIFSFEHEKSGAKLLYVENDDTNLSFGITYKTPHLDETDTNHVFEHAVLASSKKYPSKDLFFDMYSKTYSTYMNAYTYTPFTTYPISSMSQEQLEKMADVYLSCMEDPTILSDDRFFKREAIRYELEAMEDPITISGTVYGEDFGQMTETEGEAYHNTLQALYPGEIAANVNGRAHLNYQGLTYKHAVETFDRYYHFDNSLIVLYGDMDVKAFLKFLDKEYLSKAKKGETDLSQYQDGKTKPGYVEKTVDSPAYEGDSTEQASVVYYAADFSEDSWEQLYQYQIIGQMLSRDNSVLNQNLREAGISDPVSAEMNLYEEKPMFAFVMQNTDQDKSQILKEVVEQTLTQISRSGIDRDLVDASLKDLEISGYTVMDNQTFFPDELLPAVSVQWAVQGQTDALQKKQSALSDLQADTEQKLIRQFSDRFLNAERSALVTTVPKPGLAEEIEQKQADYLADMKASMTEKELKKMIQDTQEFNEWNAFEQANSDFTISVKDLPDPEPPAEVNVTDLDGITSYTSPTEQKKVSSNRIYLDTGSIKQEDLHYINLYTILASELGTEKYEKTEKDNLLSEYLNSLTFDFVYPEEYAKENHRPMLSASWYGLAEDYQQSLELLVEILDHTDLTDGDEIVSALDKNLPLIDQSRSDALILARDMAFSTTDMEFQYKNYMNGQAFYTFTKDVRDRLKAEPSYIDELRDKLTAVKDLILRKDRLIVMNAAEQEALDTMEGISEEVLGRLPSLKTGRQTYEIPKPKQRSAVIVESSSQSVFEAAAVEKPEDFYGKYFPFLAAVGDRYIIPKIRFQGGAYSAGSDYNRDMDNVFTYSSSDPKVKGTMDIMEGQADYMKDMELTQEELDGYTANVYGIVTMPYGNLEKHLKAMRYRMYHLDTEGLMKQKSQVREARIEDQADAAAAYQKLLQKAAYTVAGNQKQIMKDKNVFDVVMDYRQGMQVKYRKK